MAQASFSIFVINGGLQTFVILGCTIRWDGYLIFGNRCCVALIFTDEGRKRWMIFLTIDAIVINEIHNEFSILLLLSEDRVCLEYD